MQNEFKIKIQKNKENGLINLNNKYLKIKKYQINYKKRSINVKIIRI